MTLELKHTFHRTVNNLRYINMYQGKKMFDYEEASCQSNFGCSSFGRPSNETQWTSPDCDPVEGTWLKEKLGKDK